MTGKTWSVKQIVYTSDEKGRRKSRLITIASGLTWQAAKDKNRGLKLSQIFPDVSVTPTDEQEQTP